MTVASTTNRKEYAGNSVTTAFATSPVVFYDASDLAIYLVDAAGVATLKTITTHYTVSGGNGTTGTVTMLVAPATGENLVIVRSLPLVQAVDFVNNDASDADVAEAALDKLTMMVQQVSAKTDRSFVLADSDTSGASTTLPTPEASTLLGWDSVGTALQNYSTSSLNSALTTAFTLTLLDDPDAATARATLGALGSADPVTDAFLITGSSDTSKKIRFEVDGNTTATTRVLTPPDYTARLMTQTRGADVASSGTLNLDTASGDYVHVTGTTTVTAITLGDGKSVCVVFDNALTLTNGASLVLPTGANVVTAAGDVAKFRGEAGSVVRCVSYQRASGAPTGYATSAQVATTSGTTVTITTSIPASATRIYVMLQSVSTNSAGTSVLLQVGSGSFTTSGYVGQAASSSSSAGFLCGDGGAAGDERTGILTLVRMDSATNKWVVSGNVMNVSNGSVSVSGYIALGGALDRLRLTTPAGTATFDVGNVNVSWE